MPTTITVDADAAIRMLGAVAKNITPQRFMKNVGLRLMAWTNQNFRDGGTEAKWAPLSVNTLAARRKGKGKGSAQPLRDTGRMAQSVNMQVGMQSVEVGFSDKKAEWHHLGTTARTIRARTPEPAKIVSKSGRVRHVPSGKPLRFMTAQGWRSAYRVNYPGLPARPLLPSAPVTEQLAVGVAQAFVARVLGVGIAAT